MKKGFYTLIKKNIKERATLMNADTMIACDGETLFTVRYKPKSNELYLCSHDVWFYDEKIPVEERLKEAKQAILSNSESIVYHGDTFSYDMKSYNIYSKPNTYHSREVSLGWIGNTFSFNIGDKREICPSEYFDAVKIFVDGATCCSVEDCSGDCESYAFINKDWFYENYLRITGFSSEKEFFSNYLYPDSKKIIDEALRTSMLIGIRTPIDCKEFNRNNDFFKFNNI